MNRKVIIFFVKKFFSVFAFFCLFFLLGTQKSYAQSLNVNPASGDFNTSFTVTGSGYQNGQQYGVCAYKNGGRPLDFVSLGQPYAEGPNFSFTFSAASRAEFQAIGTGSYTIKVQQGSCGGTDYGPTAGFTLNQSAVTPPACSEACDPNMQTVPSQACPSSCPCGGATAAGPFTCGGGTTPVIIYPIHGSCGDTAIDSALGCIPYGEGNEFIGWLLKNIIFIATGVAFLLMAFGALQIITSAGNPDKIKAGQELITSAISGILFIILSVFLLRLVGVEIFKIPGFGT